MISRKFICNFVFHSAHVDRFLAAHLVVLYIIIHVFMVYTLYYVLHLLRLVKVREYFYWHYLILKGYPGTSVRFRRPYTGLNTVLFMLLVQSPYTVSPVIFVLLFANRCCPLDEIMDHSNTALWSIFTSTVKFQSYFHIFEQYMPSDLI